MKLSNKGKIALAVSEGIVTTAYKDSVGVWTIGIGHTKSAGEPNPINYKGKQISIDKVMEIFSKDIKIYENIIDRLVKVDLKQNEYDALVHFVYNIGEGNFKKSKLLVNLNKGDKRNAFQKGFHGWLKPKELKTRRDKERRMAIEGYYGSSNVLVISEVGKNFQPLFSKGKRMSLGNLDNIEKSPTPKKNWFIQIIEAIGRFFYKSI